MYGGMCHGSYAASLARLVSVFINAQVPVDFGFAMNHSLVTRARDSLVHDFLQSRCTHLMFIDSDIGFHAEDILLMLAVDRDIVCGVYPRKEIDWGQVAEAVRRGVPTAQLHEHTGALVVNTLDGAAVEVSDRPVEVLNAGSGFMLVKREVFEGLADKVPSYDTGWSVMTGGGAAPKVVKQYFDTSIDPDHGDALLSEDYHFCKLARANGFRVWVAPWVELSHTGTYPFTAHLMAG